MQTHHFITFFLAKKQILKVGIKISFWSNLECSVLPDGSCSTLRLKCKFSFFSFPRQSHKSFYSCNLLMVIISQIVCPSQPCLMFVVKARSLPWSGAPKWCFTLIGFGLNRKHSTRPEYPDRDKHSSLLQHQQITTVKMFDSIRPWGL